MKAQIVRAGDMLVDLRLARHLRTPVEPGSEAA